ncbi:hypothetical protein AZE42_12509 [Rhizopogon vesiculosus]|uniref:Uncharacterized protein n=1 Tax=Rhizopogon vesiculosus TaxID=180088 RepID=A0A1J8PV67_9AGAM|nr:hypothetical protein AZE42_12509 [Rhizopogon vesiculosus]
MRLWTISSSECIPGHGKHSAAHYFIISLLFPTITQFYLLVLGGLVPSSPKALGLGALAAQQRAWGPGEQLLVASMLPVML